MSGACTAPAVGGTARAVAGTAAAVAGTPGAHRGVPEVLPLGETMVALRGSGPLKPGDREGAPPRAELGMPGAAPGTVVRGRAGWCADGSGPGTRRALGVRELACPHAGSRGPRAVFLGHAPIRVPLPLL